MIGAVLLAAGHSRRFGSDKLLYPVEGRPMIQRAMETLPPGMPAVLVTRSQAVARLAESYPCIKVVDCPDEADDVALSIRLGLQALPEETAGAMFLVCDQPRLSRRSVTRLALCFARAPERIWVLAHGQRWGNPCVFPRRLFGELAALPEGKSGKLVIHRHEDEVSLCQIPDGRELEDMDRPEQ